MSCSKDASSEQTWARAGFIDNRFRLVAGPRDSLSPLLWPQFSVCREVFDRSHAEPTVAIQAGWPFGATDACQPHLRLRAVCGCLGIRRCAWTAHRHCRHLQCDDIAAGVDRTAPQARTRLGKGRTQRHPSTLVAGVRIPDVVANSLGFETALVHSG